MSSTFLRKAREAEIQDCFNVEVEFHDTEYTKNLKELIPTFKLRSKALIENHDTNNSMFGENKIMDCLIVMSNVSGIAHSQKEFADFLTITRKNCYHCIYVFHIIIPVTNIWKKIFTSNELF